MEPEERSEAAAMLRRILDAVDEDRLDALGPSAGLVRQIKGSVVALEALDGPDPTPKE